jgi:hypothetical protein
VVLGSLATQEFLQIPINILVEYIVKRKKRERERKLTMDYIILSLIYYMDIERL